MTVLNEARAAGHRGAPPSILRPLLVTVALVSPALIAGFWPGLAETLTFDRTAIEQGQLWRLLTGHWAHWSVEHLVWDVLAFATLLPLCHRLAPRRLWITLGGAAAAISATIWIGRPEMLQYRGLSGLDSALFVLLAAGLLRQAGKRGAYRSAVIVAAMLVGYGGKLAFELATGSAIFVEAVGFVPMPDAHLVGSLCGGLVGILPDRRAETSPATAVSPASDPQPRASCTR